MNRTHPLFPGLDPETMRRRALAKVYALLIELADEAEQEKKEDASPETAEAKEVKAVEPNFSEAVPREQDAADVSSVTSIADPEKSDDPEPSQ